MPVRFHSVTRTAYPCGKTVHYLEGMTPIEPKNLGPVMKQAAFEACSQPVAVNRKLKKVA